MKLLNPLLGSHRFRAALQTGVQAEGAEPPWQRNALCALQSRVSSGLLPTPAG